MIMKRVKYNTLIGCLLAFMALSCSDDLTIDENLSEVGYDLPQGEPGSLDALIYDVYERYGTYVLYDFDEQDIRVEWTGSWSNHYSPVPEGSEQYIRQTIEFVQKELLDGYTDDFVRRNLVYRIFLVDTLNALFSEPDEFEYLVEREHGWVIGNVGPRMAEWTDEDWNELKTELSSKFTLAFYGAASIKPTQFLALRYGELTMPMDLEDPLEEYDAQRYTTYTYGYIRGKVIANNESWLTPAEDQDFADYITFLTTTPATELMHVLDRFEAVRERAKVLVPYLDTTLGLGVAATQNKNCPNDPIAEDYFSTL